jgi:murein tripeptide amidase MpaA
MRSSKILGTMLFLFFLFFTSSSVWSQQIIQARIHLANKEQMKEVLRLNLDVAYVEYGQYIDIITDGAEVDQLRSSGYDVEIVHEDLVAFYQSRFDKSKYMGGYHDYNNVMVALDSMHMRYPSLTTSKINIGNSLEGRAIWALKISDNPDIDEDEPEVFYNGLTHAREPIGMEVLLYFMWNLLTTYGTDSLSTYLVNNRELWFVPVVNPDGYEYNRSTNPSGGGMWRKNRRVCEGGDYGVDLNRNFGYMWGYDNEGSSPYCSDETYRGSAGFSEPETQVWRDFVNSRHFVMTLDNHTYGNDLLYPWGYANLYTPHQNLYVAIADSMSKLNGFIYGTPWEVLYPVNGGSIDWEYGYTVSKPMILAISPEIGTQSDGFWPPSTRILPLCQLELPAHRLYAELADNPYRVLPPNAPVLAEIDSVSPDFPIFWSFHDTLNPASVFELLEMSGFEKITYDVESGYSDWSLSGFTISASRSHSPTHSFYSGQGNSLNNKATSQNSITVQPGDSLKIWCWYNTEQDWDYAYVEISTNGGASFFSIPGNVTTSSNPHGYNQGNGITGSSGGWVQGKFSLSTYVGQQIYLRLHYITDGYLYYEGFYADDIYPFERYSSVISLSNTIPDTFYQISGQGQGTYFYKVRAKDAQNQWGAWSNVEKAEVASGGFVRGDLNGDDLITLGDLVFLISFLYRGGPPPDPLQRGDVNNDSQTNLGDVVYLIDYLYRGGPPPLK